MTTDLTLAVTSAARDRVAFAELVRRHRALVRTVLRGFSQRAWELEDLEQETWLQAWLGIRALRNPQSLAAWLQGVARNVGRRWLALERRQRGTQLTMTELAVEPVEQAGRDGVVHSVATTPGFERLNARHQTLLRLKYDEGRSYAENRATRTHNGARRAERAAPGP